MRRRLLVCVCLLALSGFAAFGQTSYSGGTVNGTFRGTASFSGQQHMPPVVAGAPYSGEHVSERVQTMADGTHITQKTAYEISACLVGSEMCIRDSCWRFPVSRRSRKRRIRAAR